ncbi:MAG: sigma-54 dependent transcriptional regulator, partial [Verrucomicrobiales bacterium]|nr:sigma-54 dependent transcriptional regulator [Verrucomicrobiales bacterium]
SCLILEDDPGCAAVVESLVQDEGGAATVSTTVQEAKALLEERDFDLFILDHALPDGTGSSFFFYLQEVGIVATSIMLTGLPDVSTAVRLTRNGLFDYLTKPLEVRKLVDCLRRAIAHFSTPEPVLALSEFVGQTPRMREIRNSIQRASENPRAVVLLTGETGVGKDLTARLIHQHTFQIAKPDARFVALNCSTLPAEMFEAELFGAERGAYTGAHQQRIGLVEAANGGTLFLDEIGEVPLLLQAKLLHFLEGMEYRRLGSTETLHFDGRIIAATNRSLEEEVKAGRFRSDLWYRLDVFSISLPPLRERKEEIAALAEVLLTKLSDKYRRRKPLIRPEEIAALTGYDFPGNVRELRNILERSLLQTPTESSWLQLDSAWLRKTRAKHKADAELVGPVPANLSTLEAQEYIMIRKALAEEEGTIRRAAAKLGVTHQSLLRRLKKWPELRPISRN